MSQTGSLTLTAADGARFDTPQYGVRNLPPLRIKIASPGGGGFGDPMRREPHAVLRGVRDGIVSVAKAHNVYGVVLTSDRLHVDFDATSVLRSRRSKKAGVIAMTPSMA